MARIGLIEDDRLLNKALETALGKSGYETVSAFSCSEACDGRMEMADLLLIDINLPGGDGRELLTRIARERKIPAIFLTALDEEEEMMSAFEAGADDYVVKPFSMKVLIKRIEAVLGRYRAAGGKESDIRKYGEVEVNLQAGKVTCQGGLISLSPKEYALLSYFVENAGQILTKEQILDHIWDQKGVFVVENTVSVTVNRLRKKLAPEGEKLIQNIFGIGYRFGE
ncbi:response regulator transcription factor [Roseburia hominis]